MSKELNITGPNREFESIKHIDENNIEFWTARELFPLLGYSRWESFEEVIGRARKSALNSGQIVENHFRDLTKMVDIGSNTKRAIKDWKLDRYACYLIAQNGDSKIPQIALAQTYFTVQTRRQEIFDKLSDAEKRIFVREEVTSENKKLFKTAKQAGVSNFGLFNDAGYKGLYGASLSDVEFKKGIKKDKIKGDFEARKTHFMVGGKVRQTIKDIGGELPENLKSEKHIKDVRKDIKLLQKQDKKLLLKAKRK